MLSSDNTKKSAQKIRLPNYLEEIGKFVFAQIDSAKIFLHFLGEVVVALVQTVLNSRRLRIPPALYIVEKMGYGALPVIGLLLFLIGLVLAYEMGRHLKLYGANIFIVDAIGLAVIREFAPLITAIILAGRTSAAFTAEIGTMKVREEIDALKAMGASVFDHLVTPKVVGTLIILPLLTVWADIFGLLGGMLIAHTNLGITYVEFITRLQQVVKLKTFLISQYKAPVFAFIISFVGCYQGFQTVPKADSVGEQTTRTVVQTIFCIIVADAIFSIYFSRKGF